MAPLASSREIRVLSLLASASEIVCALGMRERMVGRSHECDYPASVRDLPQATRPMFDTAASSAEIDSQVKSLAAGARELSALGVYQILPGILSNLQPTHIVTQVQCDVCAVSFRDVAAAVQREAECEAHIVSLQPDSLSAIWDDFRRVAAALGVPREGERLVSAVRGRLLAIEEVARGIPRKPSVAAIEWADPLMAAGNWTPELIELAGGRSLFGRAGQRSPWLDFEQLVRADPDIVVVMPCGFGLERTMEDMNLLQEHPLWGDLRAVSSDAVFATDGNQFFNRPGPRLAESTEILAEIIHPDHFEFGHEGAGWLRIPTSGIGARPLASGPAA